VDDNGDLSKARKKWKRAKDAVEEAQVRLKVADGKQGTDAVKAAAQARRELEDAEDEKRKTKRKFRKLKAESGE
jgi:GTP cyclohydrolase III